MDIEEVFIKLKVMLKQLKPLNSTQKVQYELSEPYVFRYYSTMFMFLRSVE
jgi:hypothetical protein